MSHFKPTVEAFESRTLLSAGALARPWGGLRRPPAEVARPSVAPLTITADLDTASDPLGDGNVFQGRVVVTGQTLPGGIVRVTRGASARPVVADAAGRFRVTIHLAEGADGVTLQARDAWGRTATTALDVTRGNAVIAWNAAALEAIRRTRTNPPAAARALAIIHASIYDAVNAVTPIGPAYLVHAKAPRGASASAAAVGAAHEALVATFPTEAALFDAALAQSIAGLGSGRGVSLGLDLGASVARRIVAVRTDDGARESVSYSPGSDPGDWRPTPPAFTAALLPQWAGVDPFVIPSGDAFRPAPPPALNSPEYAEALNEVKALGAAVGAVRSADQTEVAQFWADGVGTATPPGHWNAIAEDLSRARRESLAQSARTFALLNLSLADSAIACWDSKYAYDLWRPITAIRLADADGNPATAADAGWSSLIATPPFPSYNSGHSTFSAAAAEILTALYGGHVPFRTTSDGLPGVTRSFHSFKEAATEAGMSRIYGGIHYRFDDDAGQELGRRIANEVLSRMLHPHSRTT
ncbi:MAG: phosphatase PAP2 family protein [Isosphaeraceae bacterium]